MNGDGVSSDRRRVVAAVGAAMLPIGLSGCSGDGSEDSGDSDGGGADRGEDGGDGDTDPAGDPTESPTATDSAAITSTQGEAGMAGQPAAEPTASPTDAETTAPATTEREAGGDTGERERNPGSTPAGTATPTPSGSDAAFVGSLRAQERRTSAWDRFESITVDFQRIALVPVGGEPVELPVGEEIDLVSLDTDDAREFVSETSIPSGNYATAEYHMPIQEATLSDGSEPSAELDGFDPVSIDLGIFEEYLEAEPGTTVDFTAVLNLVERMSEDGWRVAASYSAGFL